MSEELSGLNYDSEKDGSFLLGEVKGVAALLCSKVVCEILTLSKRLALNQSLAAFGA